MRTIRMTNHGTAHKPKLRGKVLLGLACFAAGLIPVFSGALCLAQAAAPSHDIVGTWQGTLHVTAGNNHVDLRLVNKITKGDDGKLKVEFYSIDQGGGEIPASSASFQGGVFNFAIKAIDGSYEGKMSADGKSITGNWTQAGSPLPLVFERATPETEWTIPAPPVKQPPMAANADPGFEVATIKPTKPDEQRKGSITIDRSNRLTTVNTSLTYLISMVYGVQQKQIVGQPDWMDKDNWDIEAKPDVPGVPDLNQMRTMLKKLLADRFQLKFHNGTKQLSAYVLTMGKSGNKMTAGSTDPNQLPGFGMMKLGVLVVQNATMKDFTDLMQTTVFDRPVVDRTELKGKWNFQLKWTPDESQFAGLGVRVPPPTDAADAPPPLFTAIQEQLGLKLSAEKTQVPVLVIDKAEKPSPN
jgi:uncharacterized protein (TIGR03435 family)